MNLCVTLGVIFFPIWFPLFLAFVIIGFMIAIPVGITNAILSGELFKGD
jgi:hypothetical protein